MPRMLQVDFPDASGRVRKFRAPGWPEAVRVEVRRDGRDTLTLSIQAVHQVAEVRLVLLAGGVLTFAEILTAQVESRPQRTDFELHLCVPPALASLDIDLSPAGRGESPWRQD